MAKVHCFSSFTFSYFPRALILVQTLRRIHPDWVLWAVLVDEPPAGDDCGLSRQFDRVVYANDLPFERFQSWIFRHDIVEASTAVKGEMLCHLLVEERAETRSVSRSGYCGVWLVGRHRRAARPEFHSFDAPSGRSERYGRSNERQRADVVAIWCIQPRLFGSEK